MYDAVMDHEVKDLNILHQQKSLEHREPVDYTKIYNISKMMTVVDADQPKFIVNQSLQNFVHCDQVDCAEDKLFSCKLCQYRAKLKCSLKYHVMSKHPEIARKNITWKKPDANRKKPIFKHNKNDSALFTCNICTYSSNRRYNLTRHIKIWHEYDAKHVNTKQGFKVLAPRPSASEIIINAGAGSSDHQVNYSISSSPKKEPGIDKAKNRLYHASTPCKSPTKSTTKPSRTSRHRRIIQDDANVPIIAAQRLGPVAPAVVSEIINDVSILDNLLDQVIIPESSIIITERASINKVRSPDQPVFEVMSCSLCDFVASSSVALRSHVRLEHPDKPRRESARIRKVISYREDEVDEYEYEKNSSSSYEDFDEVNEAELTDESDYSTNYYCSSNFVRNKRAKFSSPPRPPSLVNEVITNDLGASTNYSKLSQNEDDEICCSEFVNNSNNLQSSELFFSPISVKNEPELEEFKELNNIEAVHDTQGLRELLLVKNDQNLITEDSNNYCKLNWQDFVRKIKGEPSVNPSPLHFYTCTICHLVRTKCKYDLMSHLKIKHPEIARKINWEKLQPSAENDNTITGGCSKVPPNSNISLEDSNYLRPRAINEPELFENRENKDLIISTSKDNYQTSVAAPRSQEEKAQEISDDLGHSADGGDICTKETKEQLVENVLYSCKICFYIAKSKSNLKNHINLEHHNSAASDPSCSSKEPIKMKVKRDVLLTCKICLYTTNREYNLTRHTKRANHNIDFPKGPKPRKETPNSKEEPKSNGTPVTKENVQQVFSCNLCTFSTNRKLNLQGHINMVHNDDKSDDDGPSCRNELKETGNSSKNGLFTCKICFYTTNKSCNLTRHTKNAKGCPKQDGKIKNVSNTITTSGKQDCNLCTFSTKYGNAGLKRHMESMHGGPKTPKIKIDACDLCGKKYYSRYSLKMHMATHFLQDSPHQCQICLKKCASIWSLKKHLATRHNDSGLPDVVQFLCSFCGKGFKQQTGLTYHTRTHHTGEKPYPCTECPKRFAQREHLVQHLSSSVHRNELGYSCDTCGRKFNKISNMQTHLKTHLNEKPFQCISCKKWFSRMDNMRNHMKRVHNLIASTVEQPE